MGAKRVGAAVTGVTKTRSFHDNYNFDPLSVSSRTSFTYSVVTLCLILGIAIFISMLNELPSISFSNTFGVTRNESLHTLLQDCPPDMDIKQALGSTRLRLHQIVNGRLKYGPDESD